VTVEGDAFPATLGPPRVTLGGVRALVSMASRSALAVVVPDGLEGGTMALRLEEVPGQTAFLEVGEVVATGLHQVDGPAVADDGSVYLTFSGSRGQQVPVSVFRIKPGGPREIFATGLANPTSMVLDERGRLYVSSRFDGTVTRYEPDGRSEVLATDLGVACGIALAPDGTLLVGDRSGTVFKVAPSGQTTVLATLPSSVAAFHLALAPDGALYVTAPTLSTRDRIYRISPDGEVAVASEAFGRPQGLAFDHHGRLHVVEALAGASGLFRFDHDGVPRLLVAGAGLVGVAFDRAGHLYVTSSDTAYRFRASLVA